MRYAIAAIVAVLFAVLAVLFISTPIASAVVQRQLFASPDSAALAHMAIFAASSLVALVVGWLAGWRLGRHLQRG
jgi:hypothetical protein